MDGNFTVKKGIKTMKTLALLLSLSLGALAQTTVATVTFTINTNALNDVYIWNHGIPNVVPGQFLTSSLTLTNAITANATSLTLTGTLTGLPASGVAVIDGECIPYTAAGGQNLNITRSAPQNTVAAAHLAGAVVNVERYATPGAILYALLAPGLIQMSQSLGASSALLGAAFNTQQNAAGAYQTAIAALAMGSGQ
jgi:hypothetical protein